MPIAQKRVFKCEKCGYSKTYTIGDCLTPSDLMKRCPKCGGKMVMSNEEPKSIFNFILRKLGI